MRLAFLLDPDRGISRLYESADKRNRIRACPWRRRECYTQLYPRRQAVQEARYPRLARPEDVCQ
jgi:hypothetical protein